MNVFALVLVSFVVVHSQEITGEMLEREKLAFIERSIIEIYKRGSFPSIFQAETQTLSRCGCEFGTQPIYWGSEVGMMCKLTSTGFDETCGARCSTPKGEQMLLLCPVGWQSDCFRGCVPPMFDNVRARYSFLENNVKQIIAEGHDYLVFDPEYLKSCGCRGEQARLIRYGTNIGFDCVYQGEPAEECSGFPACENERGESVMVFCHAGHRPTCGGCVPTVDDHKEWEEDDIRYEWSINVLTGYIRESQNILRIEPLHDEVINCGCRGEIKPVEYGNRIGRYCEIDNADDIKPRCRTKKICMNDAGKELIHFCPIGFEVDCGSGCGYWWDQFSKQEL